MILRRRSLLCVPAASGLALAFAAGACSIPYRQSADIQQNECKGHDDCGPEAVCATTSSAADPAGKDTFCASTKADLAGVIFEIRPATNAKFGAGTSYLIEPAAQGIGLQSSIAGPVPFDPVLPPLVSISPGEVNCLADMSSIPAKVEFPLDYDRRHKKKEGWLGELFDF